MSALATLRKITPALGEAGVNKSGAECYASGALPRESRACDEVMGSPRGRPVEVRSPGAARAAELWGPPVPSPDRASRAHGPECAGLRPPSQSWTGAAFPRVARSARHPPAAAPPLTCHKHQIAWEISPPPPGCMARGARRPGLASPSRAPPPVDRVCVFWFISLHAQNRHACKRRRARSTIRRLRTERRDAGEGKEVLPAQRHAHRALTGH